MTITLELYASTGRLRVPGQLNKVEPPGKAKARGGGRGETVLEIKVDEGPGRRLYGFRRGTVFIATHGTDKQKPNRLMTEITRAQQYYKGWRESNGLA